MNTNIWSKAEELNLYVYSIDKLPNKNIKTEKRVLHDSMTSIDEKENRGPKGYINSMCQSRCTKINIIETKIELRTSLNLGLLR